MEYCHLGDSGLEVSRIGLGTIPLGTVLDEKSSRDMVDMFYDAGGNYLDTANIYGGGTKANNAELGGTSERTVGKIFKGRRDRFVVATKGAWQMADEMRPNAFGLSRTYLATQIEASLRRLDTDYIDLYQCHVWDPYTPIEETMRVLDDFVREGKIRYVGVSNWDGWHVVKANMFARQYGLTPVVSNQIWYNLADRVAEFSIIPACRDQNVSIIAWGVYAESFLTGRYGWGNQAPHPGSRFELFKDSEMCSWKKLAVERNWKTLDAMARISEGHGKTIVNVAMAWVLQSDMCDVALLGASKTEQFVSSMEVLSLRLSEDEMRELKEVSELPHPYPMNFWDLFCYHDSEYYGGLR
jgi:aryl-alcohol dehydrogenase-like predicted oxidoreductase